MKKKIFTFIVFCLYNSLFAVKPGTEKESGTKEKSTEALAIISQLNHQPPSFNHISTSCPEFNKPKDPFFQRTVSERKKLFEQNLSKIEKNSEFLISSLETKRHSVTSVTLHPKHTRHARKKSNSFNCMSDMSELSSKSNGDAGLGSNRSKEKNMGDTLILKTKKRTTSLKSIVLTQELEEVRSYAKQLEKAKKENEKQLYAVTGAIKIREEQKKKKKKQRE